MRSNALLSQSSVIFLFIWIYPYPSSHKLALVYSTTMTPSGDYNQTAVPEYEICSHSSCLKMHFSPLTWHIAWSALKSIIARPERPSPCPSVGERLAQVTALKLSGRIHSSEALCCGLRSIGFVASGRFIGRGDLEGDHRVLGPGWQAPVVPGRRVSQLWDRDARLGVDVPGRETLPSGLRYGKSLSCWVESGGTKVAINRTHRKLAATANAKASVQGKDHGANVTATSSTDTSSIVW